MAKPEPREWGACCAEGSRAKATAGDGKVIGNGMVAKAGYVKQGDLSGAGTVRPPARQESEGPYER